MSWYEDELFWQRFEELLFDPAKMEQADGECEAIIDLTHLRAGASVLDQATGIGRHAIPFAQRGYAVTGVDRTKRYLERAEDRARRSGVELELVEADMRRFVREAAFDLALNLYTSFGFFTDEDDNLEVARCLQRSLRERGYAVLEMASKETIARDWRSRDWREANDGALVLEERVAVDHFSRVRCTWTIIDADGTRYARAFEHRLYAASELRALLLAAGFAKVQIYGDLTGAPFDQDAERLVAVARA